MSNMRRKKNNRQTKTTCLVAARSSGCYPCRLANLFHTHIVSSPPPDGLTSPERKRRKALEYDEDEEPQDIIQLREADVQIPNVPVPKSSDGDVSRVPYLEGFFFSFSHSLA